MKKIGIISDTHSFWDDRYLKYFEPCDEIWHAGDIGSMEVAERLNDFRPLRAVCGNCDGGDLRLMYPEKLRFKCEEIDVLMKHIGGYPGNYDRSIRSQIYAMPPQLFISGHSHILKVKYDKTLTSCTSTLELPEYKGGTRKGRLSDLPLMVRNLQTARL